MKMLDLKRLREMLTVAREAAGRGDRTIEVPVGDQLSMLLETERLAQCLIDLAVDVEDAR
jgi:hypothetical protein